jgi:hypothetical protein
MFFLEQHLDLSVLNKVVDLSCPLQEEKPANRDGCYQGDDLVEPLETKKRRKNKFFRHLMEFPSMTFICTLRFLFSDYS